VVAPATTRTPATTIGTVSMWMTSAMVGGSVWTVGAVARQVCGV
jgi:hypothetical protein